MKEDKYLKAAGEMFLQAKKKEQVERNRSSKKRLDAAVNDAAGYIYAKARGRKYFFM